MAIGIRRSHNGRRSTGSEPWPTPCHGHDACGTTSTSRHLHLAQTSGRRGSIQLCAGSFSCGLRYAETRLDCKCFSDRARALILNLLITVDCRVVTSEYSCIILCTGRVQTYYLGGSDLTICYVFRQIAFVTGRESDPVGPVHRKPTGCTQRVIAQATSCLATREQIIC